MVCGAKIPYPAIFSSFLVGDMTGILEIAVL